MTEEFEVDDDLRPIDLDTWRCKGDPIECGWEANLGQVEEENRKLLDLLQDIEGVVRDTSYRVPGDPESPSKGARILALIRSRLGHAATEQSGEPEGQS